jgi:hypothetical protein
VVEVLDRAMALLEPRSETATLDAVVVPTAAPEELLVPGR